MPLEINIMENEVIGPLIRQGMLEGMREGALTLLRILIEKRFGPIPAWAEDRLATQSTNELVDLGVRLLDVPTLEEAFQ
jgi:hypothetical protein